jgi:fatty-acyl-CoA synthase
MCYTSGTTGNPKAALYSHRSTILHAYALRLARRDVYCLRGIQFCQWCPMFHVNAWGIALQRCHSAGAKLVFPGSGMDGKSIYELIEGEGVTYAAGVPTVWQMLLAHYEVPTA